MIEIRSEWQNIGNHIGFCLFITKDGKTSNCGQLVTDWINDGNQVIETLNTMVAAICRNLYPELNDPNNELKKKKERLLEEIKIIDSILNRVN